MKLAEMAVTKAKKMNKLMESRFGFSINFNKLTVERAEKLSETISANLDRIRHSVDLHTAERNPRYMELLTVQESLTRWLDEQRTTLTEGEVSNAEVLLAAKDMVDSIQDIIEKVGKMQNEQLPQLLDSIRDQLGSQQSDSFKSAVGATLESLMPQLQSAREGIDNGVRVLSGEAVDQPMGMPGGQQPSSDLDMDDLENTDGFDATDAAAGGAEQLGREFR